MHTNNCEMITNDLLISYHTAIEKRIWMMSAELGQRPGEGE